MKEVSGTDSHSEMGRLVSELISLPSIAARFASAIGEATAALHDDPTKLAAAIVFPLELFVGKLPPEIKSCRLSVMRGGTAYHIERHPNATQYVLSLERSGAIRVRENHGWIVSVLESDLSLPITDRWHTVPANTWHQPIPGEHDWVVVAFHTVSANELIDDYDYQGPVEARSAFNEGEIGQFAK